MGCVVSEKIFLWFVKQIPNLPCYLLWLAWSGNLCSLCVCV